MSEARDICPRCEHVGHCIMALDPDKDITICCVSFESATTEIGYFDADSPLGLAVSVARDIGSCIHVDTATGEFRMVDSFNQPAEEPRTEEEP